MGRQVSPANFSRQQTRSCDVCTTLKQSLPPCLDGKRELLAVLVDADVNLVDFNLRVAHRPDGGAQVILKRIGGEAEKNIEQAVVADLSQQRLFIA